MQLTHFSAYSYYVMQYSGIYVTQYSGKQIYAMNFSYILMKTYISLSGFDTSQILSLIIKYGIEKNDRIILIRPMNETDKRGDATVQAVQSLSQQIDSNINVEIHRVEHRNFDEMVLSLVNLIKNTPGKIITNISGGPREIFLAFTIACLSQSHRVHKCTNYSDIDRVMNEITLPSIMVGIDEKLTPILNFIYENKPTTITEIANKMNVSESTVSRQVNKLLEYKAVDVTLKGKTKLIQISLTGAILLQK